MRLIGGNSYQAENDRSRPAYLVHYKGIKGKHDITALEIEQASKLSPLGAFLALRPIRGVRLSQMLIGVQVGDMRYP